MKTRLKNWFNRTYKLAIRLLVFFVILAIALLLFADFVALTIKLL